MGQVSDFLFGGVSDEETEAYNADKGMRQTGLEYGKAGQDVAQKTLGQIGSGEQLNANANKAGSRFANMAGMNVASLAGGQAQAAGRTAGLSPTQAAMTAGNAGSNALLQSYLPSFNVGSSNYKGAMNQAMNAGQGAFAAGNTMAQNANAAMSAYGQRGTQRERENKSLIRGYVQQGAVAAKDAIMAGINPAAGMAG